jgi:hypothetical protein
MTIFSVPTTVAAAAAAAHCWLLPCVCRAGDGAAAAAGDGPLGCLCCPCVSFLCAEHCCCRHCVCICALQEIVLLQQQVTAHMDAIGAPVYFTMC